MRKRRGAMKWGEGKEGRGEIKAKCVQKEEKRCVQRRQASKQEGLCEEEGG
jgi:hypothetical protein